MFKKENKEDIFDVVVPIMKMVCLHPLIPYKIEFNQDKKQFTYRKGGLMMKVNHETLFYQHNFFQNVARISCFKVLSILSDFKLDLGNYYDHLYNINLYI